MRAPHISLLSVALCLVVAWGTSGCGYVLVRVTALPPTLTPTAPVRLSTPWPHATSTLIPSTPLPTHTATATPTPIVHIVQKGDILLELAYRYDVSVQALIAANEIENPRALQIGQRLIIPMDEAALLTAQPTATPTPMPLRVSHLGFYATPAGSLWCMGEVENDRDESLDLVQLQASLYDVDGKLVDRASAFALVDVIPGHGKSPFAILFPNPPAAGYASHEIIVLSAEPITHWGRRHRALSVEQVEGEVAGDTYVMQGIVRNHGDTNAEDVRITVTAYGSDGAVVGVRQESVGGLTSGQHRALTVSLIPAAPAVRVEAVAWGVREEAEDG